MQIPKIRFKRCNGAYTKDLLINLWYLVPTGIKKFDGKKNYFSTGTVTQSVQQPELEIFFLSRPSRANRLALIGDVIEARMKNTVKCLFIDRNSPLANQIISTGFFQFRTNERNNDTKYLKFYMETNTFIEEKNKLAGNGIQPSINDQNISTMIAIIPSSLNEQKTVATFLSTIDQQIELLRKQLKLSQDMKTYYLGKLFPKDGKDLPELRFKEFTRERWQLVMLNEILKYTHSSISKKDISNDGKYPIFCTKGILGYMLSFQNDHEAISIAKDGTIGLIQKIPPKSNVLGTQGILTPNNKYNRDYCYYLLTTVDFEYFSKGTTIQHIYFKDYGSLKKMIPVNINESKKIAVFFNSIDQLVSLIDNQITFIQLMKRYYLERMFC